MRIAIVHYSAPPIIGGVETIVGEHARLFRAAGHDVTLVCDRGDADSPLGELPAIAARQDLVILHNVLTMPFDAALTETLWRLADDLPAVRFLAWIHDIAACNPDLARKPLPPALSQAHRRIEYIAVSDHRARQFASLTGRTPRVIPNGIDPAQSFDLPPHLAAFCAEHRIFDREFILLQPARLVVRKNIDSSLHVLAALRSSGRDALLLVTAASDPHTPGALEYAASLRALRSTLGLDSHAIFLHELFNVTAPDLVRLSLMADALYFPSHQEGFGLPVIEAALHRLPIFCADLPPMNSLLSHSGHMFSPASDPSTIAALIAEILDRCPATQARKETLRRYSWDSIFTQHIAPLLCP